MNKNRFALVIVIVFAGVVGYFTLFKKDKIVSNNNSQLQSTFVVEEISRLNTQEANIESMKTYITSPDKASGGNYRFKYSSELFIKDDYVYTGLNGFKGPHTIVLERFDDNIPAGTRNYNRIEINLVKTSCDYYKYCKTIKGFNIGTNSTEANFLGLYNQLLDSFEVL